MAVGSRRLSLAMAFLAASAAFLALVAVGPFDGSASAVEVPATNSQVLAAVQAAQSLEQIPNSLKPALTDDSDNAEPGKPGAVGQKKCRKISSDAAGVPSNAYGGCSFGNISSKELMIVYGDSHAGMWGAALQTVAARAGWRLEMYSLPGCPAPNLSFISNTSEDVNTQCNKFHRDAPVAIRSQDPQLVIVTSESSQQIEKGVLASPAQWRSGLVSTFASLSKPGTQMFMIGDIPQWSNNSAECLAAHEQNIQVCAVAAPKSPSGNVEAEQEAAQASGVSYISPTQWICAAKCEPVINNIRTFFNEYHLTDTYVQYLSGPLQSALGLSNDQP
jgi:hypothetical protein